MNRLYRSLARVSPLLQRIMRGTPLARLDLLLIAIILLGMWLRWGLNGTWRLGPDEALYGYWARLVASGADPWLSHTSGIDKPPLFIYATALAMHIYGYTEFATRVTSILAGTISIALTFALARQLYGHDALARLAALLMALSPFAILFSPTAYTDPLMVMWLLLAAVLTRSDRWLWAGLAGGLAALTKQEALLLAPMILILAADRLAAPAKAGLDEGLLRHPILRAARCVAALAAVTIGVEGLWEMGRSGQPSAFALGMTHYGQVGVVSPQQIVPRLAGWWDEALRWVFASPLLDVALWGGAALLLVRLLYRAGTARRRALLQPADRADGLLLAAMAFVLAARTLASFQLWNRYMLVLVPLLCILLARLLTAGRQALRPHWAIADTPVLSELVPLLAAAILLLAPVQDARAGRIPVGGDHGIFWGIEQTSLYVRENLPPGSVIYHHSLGWQFAWYLYGVHLDFWWYPSLQWLAETAAARAEHSQYIILPSWEPPAEVLAALAERGLALLPVHTARRPDGSVSFITYRIISLTR